MFLQAKYRGGWRVACTHCETKYAGGKYGHLPFRPRDNARQWKIKSTDDDVVRWETPLAFTSTYGPLVLCRAAIPLAKSSSFSSCGRCKSLGDKCADPGAEEKDDWDFDVKDEAQTAVLRVAKIIRGFCLGHYELKNDKIEATRLAFGILRNECCHDFQCDLIDGVVQEHGADPSEEVQRILAAALDGLSKVSKRAGKRRA